MSIPATFTGLLEHRLMSKTSCRRRHEARRDLARARARARNVERGDSAVRGAHEPVSYITRVNVVSLNRSCLVDAKGKGALERACACPRNIERGHSAVRS